jgi:hypothetical protein
MSEIKLDWSKAVVEEGQLAVPLDGKARTEWKTRFLATAGLLGRGEWQDVKLGKHLVRVSGITPGSEDKLRHFLESVVQEANSAVTDEAQADQENAKPRGDAAEREDSPDAQMTERFRSFASTAQRS